jgi:hypothetical protein
MVRAHHDRKAKLSQRFDIATAAKLLDNSERSHLEILRFVLYQSLKVGNRKL